MTVAKGSEAGRQLQSFIERIERVRVEKRKLADDEKVIFAELKQAGFDPKVVRAALKYREQDKSEREEFEATLATYLHALGLGEEPPLFKHFGLVASDPATRAGALEAFGAILPEHGEIIVKPGPGAAFRLRRGDDGAVVIEDWQEIAGLAIDEAAEEHAAERKAVPGGGGAGRPDSVDAARKKGMNAGRGGKYARNPYEAGSDQHAAWQDGWRAGDAKRAAKDAVPVAEAAT